MCQDPRASVTPTRSSKATRNPRVLDRGDHHKKENKFSRAWNKRPALKVVYARIYLFLYIYSTYGQYSYCAPKWLVHEGICIGIYECVVRRFLTRPSSPRFANRLLVRTYTTLFYNVSTYPPMRIDSRVAFRVCVFQDIHGIVCISSSMR